MNERETKTITTPSGHSVVLRTYLTGREVASIKSELLKGMKMSVDPSGGTPQIGDLTGEFILAQERKTLEYLVVSVDGVTDNPIEALLDLPGPDYEAILAETNNITNPTGRGNSVQPGNGTSDPA